jgi:hypothetical protein
MTLEQEPNRAVMLLASGQILKVIGVMLYPTAALGQIANMRAEAAGKLGGVSSGIGFIGSPGWAIGAGAALGILQGITSGAAKKEGSRMLSAAEILAEQTLARGLLFRVEHIEKLDRPFPGVWSAKESADVQINLEPLARRQRADTLTQYRKTENDVVHGMLTVKTETPFSHNGDDFLTVDTEFGLINIRWSAVVGYVGPLPK